MTHLPAGTPIETRILIVDDEPEIVAFLEEWLTGHGYTAHGITDPGELPSVLSADTYDLVLLDLVMPGANGLSLISGIRERCPGTSVAVLTALGDVPVAVAAAQEGAMAYLTKPVDPERVLEVVERARESGECGRIPR